MSTDPFAIQKPITGVGMYSINETCKYLNISRSCLRRWTQDGKIARGGYRECNGRPFYWGKDIMKIKRAYIAI